MRGFFEHQFLKYKKNHLRNLVVLAKADGRLDKAEKVMLKSIGLKYGLKEWQVEKIIKEKPERTLLDSLSKEEMLDQLYDIVRMILADGVVDKNEIKFFQELTTQMGFRKTLCHEIIAYAENNDPSSDNWESFKRQAFK